MLDETLAQLTATIQQASTLSAERRADLLRLLSTLQQEIRTLAETHGEHAANITHLTDVSTHQAVQQPHNPQGFEQALQGLSASVSELEASHPQLVSLVNSLCVLLSNIGV